MKNLGDDSILGQDLEQLMIFSFSFFLISIPFLNIGFSSKNREMVIDSLILHFFQGNHIVFFL